MTATNTVDPFVHEALLYRDADEYLAGTAPFVLGGLSAGEPVLVAVPENRIRLLCDRLGDEADNVQFLDMTEAGRNPSRIIPGVLLAFATSHVGSRVRIIGEPIWDGRSDLEYPVCVQHEALINSAFAGRCTSILCPYDASALAAQVLHDAARTHPVMVQRHRRWLSDHYDDPFATAGSFNLPLPDPPPEAQCYPFDVGGLARVRRLVSAFATEAGLDRSQAEDLVLAVNELTTNSILHASGHGTVCLWREGGAVVCEVSDDGQLDDPMIGRIPPVPNGVGGYGVVMVNLLCDLVRIHTSPEGTTIRVYLGG